MINKKKYFRLHLMRWNETVNDRPMPWKGEKDPYKIWLSEVILQQTRVEQGWDYYNRFVKNFPTVHHLAKARETRVFKLWEGLGYYSRCKNLLATARSVVKEKKGKFPEQYEEILSLKGVGAYTAAAIASFAFNLPYAVVDGNVLRVLARYFGNDTSIDSVEGKKLFTLLAGNMLDKKAPGIYNQALMDFGALVCRPQSPGCGSCPMNKQCTAYLKGWVHILPVRKKSIVKITRWLYYLIIEHNGKVYIRKRGKNDIWENLYEFILIETKRAISLEELKKNEVYKKIAGISTKEKAVVSPLQSQQLTHQTIRGRFIHLKIAGALSLTGYKPVSYGRLSKLPLPKFIAGYLSGIPK